MVARARPTFVTDFVEELPHVLVVDTYGCALSKESERLVVKCKAEVLEEAPLMDLEQVLVLSPAMVVSTEALRACAERGIPMHFLASNGEPYATVLSANLTGTVQTRREQLLAYRDERGVTLARAFALGKMQNQMTLLRYLAKNRRATQPELHAHVHEAVRCINDMIIALREAEASRVDELRPTLFSCEGRAAEQYWAAVGLLLTEEAGFAGREGRGAQDLTNSLLNYGYGVLYGTVQRAVVLAGLDPFGGFIHVDRPGKPSLVLDMVEEFRQMVVDRTVIAMLNLGMPLELDEDGRLTVATRRLLVDKLNERLETPEPYVGSGGKRDRRKVKSIVVAQARRVAAYVRGQIETYEAYAGRW